jgi:hypothetical protein
MSSRYLVSTPPETTVPYQLARSDPPRRWNLPTHGRHATPTRRLRRGRYGRCAVGTPRSVVLLFDVTGTLVIRRRCFFRAKQRLAPCRRWRTPGRGCTVAACPSQHKRRSPVSSLASASVARTGGSAEHGAVSGEGATPTSTTLTTGPRAATTPKAASSRTSSAFARRGSPGTGATAMRHTAASGAASRRLT